eukprot:scaffold20325_cov130-Isochrysis_galbana.AAC.2
MGKEWERGGGVTGRQKDRVCSAVSPLLSGFFFYEHLSTIQEQAQACSTKGTAEQGTLSTVWTMDRLWHTRDTWHKPG